ncbi:uncharacterized protein LOC134288896 [Aedes albopictus]|uniref:Endonuclease/exonuclease/phosphatase domain-containing protein n=1 Tax=Aedes albopictus TaxID=7160 RepID=A0ABM2A793_AEDAL
MGDPLQLDSVLPSAASEHRSRRGPVVESAVEVLQPPSTGKYLQYANLSVPDRHSVSSLYSSAGIIARRKSSSCPTHITSPTHYSSSIPPLDPGRTTLSSTEAPDPPSSVAPFAVDDNMPLSTRSCHPSRPGPESSAGDGVFQSANQGMYNIHSSNSRPEDSSIRRSSPRDANVAAASSNVVWYYQNVGGINSSIAEYQLALSDGSYDVYAFTETWLNDDTISNQLFDDSFVVYRQDRSPSNSNKSIGGGVLLAVRSGFRSRLINPPNCSSVEQLWVAISTVDAKIYVCIVYIPPDRVNDISLIESHIDSLNWVVSQMAPRDNVVILGDFNMSTISWQRDPRGAFFPCSSRSSLGEPSRELLDAYCTAGLKQMVGVENENNRSLDLCFVSNELTVDCMVTQAPAPLVKIERHHLPLLINLEKKPHRCFHDTSESITYDFSRAKFDEMDGFLARVDWNGILSNSDVNLAASVLLYAIDQLLYAIDQFVPKKSKREPSKPAWSNADLKNLKRVKQAALRRHSKYRTDSTRTCYLEANTSYKQLNDRLYNAHLVRLQNNLKSNPKSFWRHVNDQRKETGLPSTMTDGLYMKPILPPQLPICSAPNSVGCSLMNSLTCRT